MGSIPARCSTPMSRDDTGHTGARSSPPPRARRPTSSTACTTTPTRPTCGSRSTTPIPPARPIMCSDCVTCSATGSRRGSRISRTASCTRSKSPARIRCSSRWSVILRKLSAAGPGNALSRALRALGRIERTLFTLQWLSDPALRERSHAGLNKGEASNSLRRAIFFHRQGEIRDRTFENQSFRASGLSLITAAIVHWNTVYLDRAVRQLRAQGATVPDDLLAHVAPLGWEHIGLTGDYVWSVPDPAASFRPLRDVRATFPPLAA